MKRWDRETGEMVESAKADAFLGDVAEVCRKHGLCLGHESNHGAFVVYNGVYPDAIDWLMNAHLSGAFDPGSTTNQRKR